MSLRKQLAFFRRRRRKRSAQKIYRWRWDRDEENKLQEPRDRARPVEPMDRTPPPSNLHLSDTDHFWLTRKIRSRWWATLNHIFASFPAFSFAKNGIRVEWWTNEMTKCHVMHPTRRRLVAVVVEKWRARWPVLYWRSYIFVIFTRRGGNALISLIDRGSIIPAKLIFLISLKTIPEEGQPFSKYVVFFTKERR